MDEQTLYDATCRYVERTQELSGQTLSVEEWERTIEAVMVQMRFLVKRPTSCASALQEPK